jgi:hypothetical protein
MAASGSSITRRAEDLVQLAAIRRDQVALEHGFTERATALDRLSFRLSVLRLVAFLATVGAIPRPIRMAAPPV